MGLNMTTLKGLKEMHFEKMAISPYEYSQTWSIYNLNHEDTLTLFLTIGEYALIQETRTNHETLRTNNRYHVRKIKNGNILFNGKLFPVIEEKEEEDKKCVILEESNISNNVESIENENSQNKNTIKKDGENMKKTNRKSVEKVSYTTIENNKSMPVAFLDGKVKTAFRMVKTDNTGFFVSIKGTKQYIAKTEKAVKGVSTVVIEGTCKLNNTGKNSAPKAEKKETAKTAPTKTAQTAPKEKESIAIEYKTVFPSIVIPANIENLFGKEVSDTIYTLVKQSIEGVTIGEGENAKHIEGWSALTGKFLDEKITFCEDGLERLSIVESFNELQVTMLSYFLSDTTKRMISKYVQMGQYYKSLDKREEGLKMAMFSYQNAPSSDERLQFEIDEVYNELIISAYDKVFSESMFSVPAYAFTSVFFRITNVIRKMKGKTSNRITRELIHNDYETVSQLDSSIFNELSFLNEDEKEVMEMIISGYKLKEIDDIKGQRMDRKVKSLRKKLESVSGLSIKDFSNAKQKELIKKQRQAKKEMILKKKEQMENEVYPVVYGKTIARYEVGEKKNISLSEKTLKEFNAEMIDKQNRMKKEFNSKIVL